VTTFVPPIPTRELLPNGLALVTLPRPLVPMVNLTFVIKSGAAQDPATLPGLAGLMAEMLQSGTPSHNAEQIADALENRGAALQVHTDQDAIFISTTVLSEHALPVLEILTDLVLHPSFAQAELERARRRRLAALAEEEDDPARQASRAFRAALYGKHPYGHTALGTEAALLRIQPADLQAFHTQQVHPKNCTLILVGDLDSTGIQAAARATLLVWLASGAPTLPPAAAMDAPPHVVMVDRPGAPQSELRVGHLGRARLDPDYMSVYVMNAILGGLFNSRVNMNLREDKGYTYGAFSAFQMWRSRGVFGVGAAVETRNTLPAIREILKEIERMRNTDVSLEELTLAQSGYALALPGYFEDLDAIAEMAAGLVVYDLPLDYYRKVADQVRAVTVADVRHAAERYLTPEALSIVVVGDAVNVAPGLADLNRGPVLPSTAMETR